MGKSAMICWVPKSRPQMQRCICGRYTSNSRDARLVVCSRNLNGCSVARICCPYLLRKKRVQCMDMLALHPSTSCKQMEAPSGVNDMIWDFSFSAGLVGSRTHRSKPFGMSPFDGLIHWYSLLMRHPRKSGTKPDRAYRGLGSYSAQETHNDDVCHHVAHVARPSFITQLLQQSQRSISGTSWSHMISVDCWA